MEVYQTHGQLSQNRVLFHSSHSCKLGALLPLLRGVGENRGVPLLLKPGMRNILRELFRRVKHWRQGNIRV